MSDVIRTHFDPGMYGISHWICGGCGMLTEQDNMSWNFDTKTYEYLPRCPVCSNGQLGEMLTISHNLIKVSGEIRMRLKADRKVWEEVEEYTTKAGKTSTWKMSKNPELTKTWNDAAERTRKVFSMPDIIKRARTLNDDETYATLERSIVRLYQEFGVLDVTEKVLELLRKDSWTVYPITLAGSWHGVAKGSRGSKMSRVFRMNAGPGSFRVEEGDSGWANMDAWRGLLDGNIEVWDKDIAAKAATLEFHGSHKDQSPWRKAKIQELVGELRQLFAWEDALKDDYLRMSRGALEPENINTMNFDDLEEIVERDDLALPPTTYRERGKIGLQALRMDVKLALINANNARTQYWYDPSEEKRIELEPSAAGYRVVSYLDELDVGDYVYNEEEEEEDDI